MILSRAIWTVEGFLEWTQCEIVAEFDEQFDFQKMLAIRAIRGKNWASGSYRYIRLVWQSYREPVLEFGECLIMT